MSTSETRSLLETLGVDAEEADVELGAGVHFGPGVRLEGRIRLGEGVHLGARVTLRDVELGEGVRVEDGSTLGYRNSTGQFRDWGKAREQAGAAPVVIGARTLIRNNVTIYHDVRIGAGCWINHGAIVRERTVVADDCSIGSYTILEKDVTIAARCVIHNHCMVCPNTVLEPCVFVGPGVTFTGNSPIDHLRDLPNVIVGPKLRFGCALGGGVTLNPGVEVGRESIVATGAVVTSDLGDEVIVGGVPARVLKPIPRDWKILEEYRDLEPA